MNVKEARIKGCIELTQKNGDTSFITSPSAALDVDCFLEDILQKPRSFVLAHGETELTENEQSAFFEWITKRKTGLPVAYITGHKEFYGYDFLVTPSVLIPKPDTELLVEKCVLEIKEKILARPNSILTICDMCTGSGCIAISVMKELLVTHKIPLSRLPKFTLVDISLGALEVAKANAQKLLTKTELERVRFIRSNLFEAVPGSFDFILTNPPYVPGRDAKELLKDGRSEPLLALDGDITENGSRAPSNDGLSVIRRLIPQVHQSLSPYGVLFMETGEYNACEASLLLKMEGFLEVETFRDLAGDLRLSRGKKASL